jgi:hypothetical protein
MKPPVIGSALKAAAERLGLAAGISYSPVALAYEIGQYFLHIRKRNSANVQDGTNVLGELFFSFFKTKTDNAVVAEEVAFSLLRSLRDEGQFADDQIMAFFKALSDVASIQDNDVLSFQKSLEELVADVEDHASLLTNKVREDAGLISDAINSKNSSKGLKDAAGTVDQHASQLIKPKADSAAFADLDTLALVKTLAELPQARDAATKSGLKARSNVAQFTDTKSLTNGLVKQESALISDTGLVRVQSYAEDFSYFAEDYVGASRTF